jgi:hypothetical protein
MASLEQKLDPAKFLAYAGAAIDKWIAPALTEANPSPVPWTQEELFSCVCECFGHI